MQIYFHGFGGVLVSPGGATTSVRVTLTFVSSSVFCLLVLMDVPLFLYLYFPLSMMVLFSVLIEGSPPC